jgi:putative ABC transport system ATP-binding protein
LLQGGLTPDERDKRVREMIDRVHLTKQINQRPSELSGGQRQRVAIARALVTRPKIVLADEPTANLDSSTGQAILDLMKELNRDHTTTFIFSTHDPKVMERATRIIKLVDGRLLEDRETAEARG